MRLDQTLARLQKAGTSLVDRPSRLARRNARRKFHAALNAAKRAVDREYPLIPSRRPDRIEEAAESMDWKDFQSQVIKNVSRRWEKTTAQEFVAFVSDRLAFGGKAVLLDLQSPCRWLADSALPVPSPWNEWNRGRWLCLFHELAHCRQSGHRRAFVRELSVIYRLWLEFLADHRKRQRAARAVTAPSETRDSATTWRPSDLRQTAPQQSDLGLIRGRLLTACQSPITDLLSVLRQRAQVSRSEQPKT